MLLFRSMSGSCFSSKEPESLGVGMEWHLLTFTDASDA